MQSDDDDIDEGKLFDITNTKLQSWESKDRCVATVRISDKAGLSDMKILLALRLKVHQMELDLGLYFDEHWEEH